MIAVTPPTNTVARPARSGSPLLASPLAYLLSGLLLTVGWLPARLATAAPDPNLPSAGDEPPAAVIGVETPGVEPALDASAASRRSEERPFRNAINRLERKRGAYAEGLSEQLLGLGLNLQRQGRHGEALEVFKRGVHLARINNGLYSAQQLPLLQAEIASHLATGELAEADERQQYLYRVQVRSLDRDSMTNALIQQANWQYSAYRWELGGPGFLRLMNMWDLYRLALNDIATREGETSDDLLPPLYGMLRAQYLIAQYEGEEEHSGFDTGDSYNGSLEYNRFHTYRNQSYDKGRAVIQAIYDIEQQPERGDPVAAAEALVMLGDWHLWHKQREQAYHAYAEAMAELAERDDAQLQVARLFGQPVALPSLEGVGQLPATADPESANILLEFAVTGNGRVTDLDRIDDSEISGGPVNRLMRTLRKTRFRPRFENGEPVKTENVVWAYDIEE